MTSESLAELFETFDIKNATRPNANRRNNGKRPRWGQKVRSANDVREILKQQLLDTPHDTVQSWPHLLTADKPVGVAVLVQNGFCLPHSAVLDLDTVVAIVNATLVAYCGGQARHMVHADDAAYANERFNLPRGIYSAILCSVLKLHELWNLFSAQNSTQRVSPLRLCTVRISFTNTFNSALFYSY